MTGPTPPANKQVPNQETDVGPNEFGKLLTGIGRSIRPYQNLLIGGVFALIVVSIVSMIWSRNAQARSAAAWDRFATCQAPEDFEVLAKEFNGQPVGQWSQLQAARQYLREGLEQVLTNRSVSDERLKLAKDSFNTLLVPNVNPLIREEALYGVGTAAEALSDGKDKAALEAYEQLLREFPQSQHRLWVAARVSALKSSSTDGFYAWFRTQNPKPADRPTPLDGRPATDDSPLGDMNLPTLESLELPIAPLSESKAAPAMPVDAEATPENPAPAKPVPETTTEAAPAAAPKMEAPAKTEDAPKADAPKTEGDAKPAEEPKKEETKKEDAKPAEPAKEEAKPSEKPADEKPAEAAPAKSE